MNAKERAQNLKRIVDDEAFKDLIAGVKEVQNAVFLDSSATIEEIQKAHHVIQGVAWIERYINSVLDAEKVYDKKQK
jgi:hypothetical protein